MSSSIKTGFLLDDPARDGPTVSELDPVSAASRVARDILYCLERIWPLVGTSAVNDIPPEDLHKLLNKLKQSNDLADEYMWKTFAEYMAEKLVEHKSWLEHKAKELTAWTKYKSLPITDMFDDDHREAVVVGGIPHHSYVEAVFILGRGIHDILEHHSEGEISLDDVGDIAKLLQNQPQLPQIDFESLNINAYKEYKRVLYRTFPELTPISRPEIPNVPPSNIKNTYWTVGGLAEYIGLEDTKSIERINNNLDYARKNHKLADSDWDEVANPTGREPRYLYKVSAMWPKLKNEEKKRPHLFLKTPKGRK